DWFGWRWIFAGIAVYSLPLCLLLWRYLPQRQAGDLPGREGYLRQLRQPNQSLICTPSGTPNTSEPLMPMKIRPIARP
ncbi:hypothetical protein QM333_35495, partial [Pseudomonas aeruginosa]|nr:hypothetical protein [Pseudomonas aeruginosa]